MHVVYWSLVLSYISVSIRCALAGFDTIRITVEPVTFACPLFRELREPNKTAKLKGANINCRPKKDEITTVFRIANF